MDADLDPHLGPYFLPLRFKLYPLLSRPHPTPPKKTSSKFKNFHISFTVSRIRIGIRIHFEIYDRNWIRIAANRSLPIKRKVEEYNTIYTTKLLVQVFIDYVKFDLPCPWINC